MSSLQRCLAATVALAGVLALVAWIYAPGVNGPQLLDDYSSLSSLEGLSSDSAKATDYIFGDDAGPLGRPVSLASFVLERLYLDAGLAGSKAVNISLHLLNGLLVSALVYHLLSAVRLPAPYALAVASGALWLLSPLLISTVLYVVQRMAMLATTFMLAALISYCRWRLALIAGKRGTIALVLVPVFVLLAIFSKENAIVVLPILLMMECCWFGFTGAQGQPLGWLRRVCLGLIGGGALFLLLVFTLGSDWVFSSYRFRDFTPLERVLTQSRILWDYLGQLLWPQVSRMGVHHDDIVLSRGLFDAEATAVSVFSWLAVGATAFVACRWRSGRLLAFGLVFFVLGHATESTVLPLELYYEHRNYFPGVGVFILLATACGLLIQRWQQLRAPVLAYLGVFALFLAMQTSSQVQIWSSTPLLRMQQVNAHPLSFRSNVEMASQMASVGELAAALDYSARAHEGSATFRAATQERPGDRDIRDLALACMANQALPADRLAGLGRENAERPLALVHGVHVLVQLHEDNACPDFDWLGFANAVERIYLGETSPTRGATSLYYVLAALENSLQRYPQALEYSERYLMLSPGNTQGLLMQLHFLTALGQLEKAAELRARLKVLEKNGSLTAEEAQTLALYLEN